MAWAQSLGNSPYSALGIGDMYSEGNVTNMGMGGIGVSFASPFYLNLQNPALLARRSRFTVFEVGLVGQSKGLSQNVGNTRQSQRNSGANLGYLALAFPANSRWNMSLSLRPYTFVNYATKQTEPVPGTNFTAEYNYKGEGGLNKATFSNGVRITKNIYAGVDASFLFGNITHSSDSRAYIGAEDMRVNRLSRTTYSDVVWRLGAAWRPKLSEAWTLNVGATYDPQVRINARQTEINQQTSLNYQALAAPDTIRLNSNGQLTLPQQARFGISLERNNTLVFGVDVGFQQWSLYRTPDNRPGNLVDGMNIAAGIEYTPKASSMRYRDLITYRAGFQYNRLPYQVRGEQINDINGSVGLSLPLGAYLVNHVTLSVVGGQRGVLSGTQIREQYVRFALGFSLNDWWFRKQVVD
ncbi:membrane protein [Spirosoma daeguense]